MFRARRWPLCAFLLALPTIAIGCDRPVETSQSLMLRVPEAAVELSPHGPVSLFPVSVGGVERGALFAPAPSRIRFGDVTIPDAAHLDFAVGMIDTAKWRNGKIDSARFALDVIGPSGNAERAWSLDVNPSNWNSHKWNETSVDLGAYAGQAVDLVLTTEALEGKPGRAAWRSPVIRGPGASATRARTDIPRWRVKADLLEDMAPPLSLSTFDAYDTNRAGLVEAHSERVEARAAQGGEVLDPAEERLRFQIDVPEHAALEVAGEVLVGPDSGDGVLGPITFRAEIDGQVVLHREIGTPGRMINAGGLETLDVSRYNGLTFSEQIPLDTFAGRSVELVLHMDSGASDDVSWWTGIFLLESEPRVRRTAGDGRNLLVVLVDTLRADHLGLYGYDRPVSPRIDAFGDRALVFDRAIAQASWTQPSVASLFTGLQPLEHGVVGGVPLDPAIETLATALQGEGFTTVALSANSIIGRRAGLHRGFEEFIEIPEFRAGAITDLFDLWLAENSEWEWFAYLHYMDPHVPFDPPPPFIHHYTTNIGIPLVASERDGMRDRYQRLQGLYDGEIEYLDTHFGRLLDTLEARGVLENTVIVFVGDHGEEFGEHGKLFHGKDIYEETIHVPLIVFAPGLVEPGRAAGTVEVRNIMEWVLELLGLRASDSPTSRLTEARTGAGRPAFSHTTLARDEDAFYELAAITHGSWRYIRRLDTGEAELYDRSSDPGERNNLVDSKPDQASRLADLLDQHLVSRPSVTRERDPGLIQKLRALGYVD